MTQYELYFNCAAISLNNCEKIGRGKMYKSSQYIKFRKTIWPLLAAQRETFKTIGENFIHGEHFFQVAYTFGIPEDKFFTKKKTINKKSGDVDNLIKPVNDLIFRSMELFNKEIDDGLILTVGSKKVPSENYFINVKIILDSYENIC